MNDVQIQPLNCLKRNTDSGLSGSYPKAHDIKQKLFCHFSFSRWVKISKTTTRIRKSNLVRKFWNAKSRIVIAFIEFHLEFLARRSNSLKLSYRQLAQLLIQFSAHKISSHTVCLQKARCKGKTHCFKIQKKSHTSWIFTCCGDDEKIRLENEES